MKDRRALFDLRAHRQQVLDELQAISGIDPADAVRTLRDEIEIVEGCIMELDAPTGA